MQIKGNKKLFFVQDKLFLLEETKLYLKLVPFHKKSCRPDYLFLSNYSDGWLSSSKWDH